MAETKPEKEIPIRIKIILEIKQLLNQAGIRGLSVEKLVAEFMISQGFARRLTMECIDAVAYSGFGKYIFPEGDVKEKIIVKCQRTTPEVEKKSMQSEIA